MKMTFNNGIVERPSIILSTKNFRHLGALNNVVDFNYKNNWNAANEISFAVYKEVDNKKETLWDEIIDLRVIAIKNSNEDFEYYEIEVDLDDECDAKKNITGTALCEAELGQVILWDVEINTELDLTHEYVHYDEESGMIKYEDVVGRALSTTFCNPNNPSKSLLHRVLEKVPNYSVGHVDDSLLNCTKVREFTFDGTDIYSALTKDISTEFDVLFTFTIQKNGQRYVNAYAIEETGIDTTIYSSVENLTDHIKLKCDVGNIKNCFRLEGGDDLMTSIIADCNAGSRYMYYFSDDSIQDMSWELRKRLILYNQTIENKSEEYKNVSKDYYRYNSWYNYFRHSMIPIYESEYGNVTASTEAQKLNAMNGTSVALPSKSIDSMTVNTAIKNAAKLLVYTQCVKIEIESYSCKKDAASYIKSWTGKFIVTNLSDDKDVVTTETISVNINDNYETYVNQRIAKFKQSYDDLKAYNVINITDSNVLKITLTGSEEFSNVSDTNTLISLLDDKSPSDYKESKSVGYSYELITGYNDAYIDAVDMLSSLKQDNAAVKSFITTYTNLQKVANEVCKLRQAQLDAFSPTNPGTPTYKAKQRMIELKEEMNFISILQASYVIAEYSNEKSSYYCTPVIVDVNNYNDISGKVDNISIGDTVYVHVFKQGISSTTDTWYKEFCSFKREDEYINSNYFSDGKEYDELFELAEEFIESARNEIYKSGNKQYTINSNLKNLMLIPEFEPIIEYFDVGNWIRLRADEAVYRLRLISYSINYSDVSEIQCEFSDVANTKFGLNDTKSIIDQAKSMATSYNAVTKQAQKGNEASKKIYDFVGEGLKSAINRIATNDTEEFVFNKLGIVGRSYDDFTGIYDNNQIRITHNMLAFTNNNWESASLAIGENEYYKININPTNQAVSFIKDTGYGVAAKYLSGSYVYGSEIIGGQIYSENYSGSSTAPSQGMHIDLWNGAIYSKNFKIDTNGNANFNGNIVASSGDIGNWTITDDGDLKSDNGSYKITLSASSQSIVSQSGHAKTILAAGYLKSQLGDDGNKVELTSGKIVFLRSNTPYATFTSSSWEDTEIYGSVIHSEPESKFISFGNKSSDSDDYYSTPLVLNYGLNPSGYEEKILFFNSARFIDKIIIGGVNSNNRISSTTDNKLLLYSPNSVFLSNSVTDNIYSGIDLSLSTNSSGAYSLKVGGDIRLPDVTSASSGTRFHYICAQTGESDFVGIRFENYGEDKGRLALCTGDNGTEPICVRQYNGNPFESDATLIRTATLLDENGNTSFPGFVNNMKFIAKHSLQSGYKWTFQLGGGNRFYIIYCYKWSTGESFGMYACMTTSGNYVTEVHPVSYISVTLEGAINLVVNNSDPSGVNVLIIVYELNMN